MSFEQLIQFSAFSQQPADNNMGLVVGRAGIVEGIGISHPYWGGQSLLQRHLNALIQPLEASQGFFLEHTLVLGGVYIAKGHENGIGGMVVAFVKFLELFVG